MVLNINYRNYILGRMQGQNLHAMELPRLIEMGEGNISRFGEFLSSLVDGAGYVANASAADMDRASVDRVSFVSGTNVQRILRSKIERSLQTVGMEYAWHTTADNRPDSLDRIHDEIRDDNATIVAGVGGGRSVDTAKMIAHNLKKPFVSVPTAASHDGMASPFVSIKRDKPTSVVASTPMGVFVDIEIIRSAPSRLLASGCGDLIANIIAVKDWQLGHLHTNEYYGRYAASLAMLSATVVIENSAEFAERGIDVRLIVEGLISAGVASCIAGSSRPCSGAEHLFSHALDIISPGVGMHGEKCGLGSIMMAKLHGMEWRDITKALKDVGAPTTAGQIGLSEDHVVEALCIAQGLRPERYTILERAEMTRGKAMSLAKSTGII